MRRFSRAALALGCCWLAGAHGQEPEREREQEREQGEEQGPDLDFLEYLGTWAEEDDEWLALETWERDNAKDVEEDSEESESERDQDDENE